MTREKLEGNVTLYCGDCLQALDRLKDNLVDSVVTDPPYHLTSTVKRFGKKGSAPAKDRDGAFKRMSRGFMGKKWDGGDIAFRPETWEKVFRVLKPGGYLLAFCGTRTYHRMATAIEDAGFDVRDCVHWLYASGFPKSGNISKQIDKLNGVKRDKIRVHASKVRNPKAPGAGRNGAEGATRPWIEKALECGYHEMENYEPVSDEAKEWDGWGTQLKPAVELICMARKPISEKSNAANLLKWGTGAINIRACEVGEFGGAGPVTARKEELASDAGWGYRKAMHGPSNRGRWPANVMHDGSQEVEDCFPHTQSRVSVVTSKPGQIYANGKGLPSHTGVYGFNDEGPACRVFFTPKADVIDRIGSEHATIKPVDLLQNLVRLVTKRGGVVLDLFAGTGTTGEAAYREGCRSILMEMESDHQEDIRQRMSMLNAGWDSRMQEAARRQRNRKGERPRRPDELY